MKRKTKANVAVAGDLDTEFVRLVFTVRGIKGYKEQTRRTLEAMDRFLQEVQALSNMSNNLQVNREVID